MQNNLILRIASSPFTTPYNDFTKGSVLTQAELDGNQLYLKGETIYTAITNGNLITLVKLNGNTISFNGGSGTDTYVTGGTYSNGSTTFTNNTGGTFNVTGFFTGGTDVYVTGGTINGSVITFTNNTGGTFNVTGVTTGSTDTYVTGGTVSAGTATFTNNTGGTFNVIGFVTGDTFITGMTFNNGNYDLTISRNDNISFTQSLSILATDMTVTGGTYNNNTGVVTFTNNSGGTFSVTGFITGFTDTFVSGGTFTVSAGTATFTNTTGGTFDVTGFTTGGTGGDLYTNSAATPTTIGGIDAGSTFSAQTMQQMWDALLYPYQFPAFSSFSLGISSPKEIGYDIIPSQTFTWSTTNSYNVAVNSVTINGYNLTTLTGLANDGSEPVTFTGVVTRSSGDGPGTRGWNIGGTNTHSGFFSTSFSVRWDWRMYAGTNAATSLTAAGITGLTNFSSVQNGFVGTYNMSAGGYKYFAFADVYGTPNTFVDTSNNLNVAMYAGFPNTDGNGNTYDLVSVTNVEGETTNYRVYRSQNILVGTINIHVG